MRYLLLTLTFALAACRTTGGVPEALLAQLYQDPSSYLSGEVSDLGSMRLLNNQDFVYTVAVSRDGTRVAFTHLGSKFYQLGLWTLDKMPRQLWDVPINHYEFDVESIDFSPDGAAVATASRDGSVRVYASKDGAALKSYATEEPLVAIAFHPSGKYLAVGSARGRITVLTYPELVFAFEHRAHEDEVRSLAFTADGTLYSGGWDKTIVAFTTKEEEVTNLEARLKFERHHGLSSVRGTVNGRVSAIFAFDERVPHVVVNTEVAKLAGIDTTALQEEVTIATAMGQTLARVARGQTLSFKGLTVPNVDVAVCDVCVPTETQGVLGESFTQRFEAAFDESTQEARLRLKNPSEGEQVISRLLTLKQRKRLTFKWYVNDLSLDRAGRLLGVAFSEVKAQRTREVYEREKKGVVEPKRDGNAGAIVDAQTGLIVQKWSAHDGVVATAAISPDGLTLATGGWDKRVLVHGVPGRAPLERELGWSIRRVRFSPDGRFLAVAAWTPQNPLGDQQSKPSALLYDVLYAAPQIASAR